ncbi:MAG TPA: signal peptidase II [Rickettsiales bacterium]|nr:signal peptidase II [Rickettsiales bacterium]
MKFSPLQLRLAGFGLAVITAYLDQWSKALIIAAAKTTSFPVTVLPVFNIALVFNRGISFGMLSQTHAWGALLLPLVLSAIVLALVVWLVQAETIGVSLALGLIIGGAAGNLIDRARAGMVTDFLDFHIGHYHWPAFNIADSAIFIGVVIFIFTNIIGEKIAVKDNSTI